MLFRNEEVSLVESCRGVFFQLLSFSVGRKPTRTALLGRTTPSRFSEICTWEVVCPQPMNVWRASSV